MKFFRFIVAFNLLVLLGVACSTNNSHNLSASTAKHKRIQEQGVVSLDVYQQGLRTHVLTGQRLGNTKTLWYQFSDDGGETWSEPSKVLAQETLAIKMGRGRDAQIVADKGVLVATWVQYVKTGRFHTGPMQAARSVDDGETWQSVPAPPDWDEGPHGFIDMTAGKNGIQVVWLDSRNKTAITKGGQSLQYSRSIDGGLNWSANKTLDARACSCCWNTIKTDKSGDSFVIYRDKNPSDMSFGLIDQQDQWRYLGHVGSFNWKFDGCPHIGAGLGFQSINGTQRIHASVGTGKQNQAGVYYLFSDDRGNKWSPPFRLGDESATHSDIAANDTGRVIAVWDMMSDQGFAVFSAESSNYGKSWSQPRQLSQSGRRATHPRVVSTSNGFLVLWTESDGQITRMAKQRLQ